MKLKKIIFSCLLFTISTSAFAGQFFVSAAANYGGPQVPNEEITPTLDRIHIHQSASAKALAGLGESITSSNSHKDGDNSFGATAAIGYLFNTPLKPLQLGAEINYHYFSDSKYDTDFSVDAQGHVPVGVLSPSAPALNADIKGDFKDTITYSDFAVGVLGLAQYNIIQGLYVQTSFGMAVVNQQTKHTVDVSGSASLNGKSISTGDIPVESQGMTRNIVRPEMGLQVGYKFTPNIAAHLGFDYIVGESTGPNPQASDINAISHIPDMMSYNLGVTYFI